MDRFKIQVKRIGGFTSHFAGRIAEGVVVKFFVEQIFHILKLWGLL